MRENVLERWRPFLLTFGFVIVALLVFNSTAHAATLPSGFSETLIANSISNPTAFAFASDGRIFVTQQNGNLRVIKNNALLATPFVTLTVNSTGERGLLGVALDPDFPNTPYVYLYYTATTPTIHNRVSRFTADGDVATGGETILLDLEDLGATNHNGGAIHFGNDGKLYVAVGENAVPANSQTLNNRLGKILRINSDGSIPTDNPFYNTATDLNRAIWVMGLRNPFTFGFQQTTGRMFINDVGAGTWEEINDGIAGSNYGWSACEGFCNPPNASYRDPLLTYHHSTGAYTGCAIVGGAFYNPTTVQFPADYVGDYFYADLCSGWIRKYDIASNTSSEFATGISNPVDLYVSGDGALYYLARGAGAVLRVTYSAPQNTATPTATRSSTPTHTPTTVNTATRTPTRTATRTATQTRTLTRTATRTTTQTRTLTRTATRTATATRTNTRVNTPTSTFTRTNTRVVTATFTPDGAWNYCAKEGRTCTFSGTRQVRFGANGKYKIKTFTTSTPCTVAVFGDPAPGVAKHCHYQ